MAINWDGVGVPVGRYLVKRLQEAKMTNALISWMVPVTIREAVLYTLKGYKNIRGRPKGCHPPLTADERLKVLEAFYEGHDLIEIAKRSGADINSMFIFLVDDIVAYGYGNCRRCGIGFVYFESAPIFCPTCSPKAGEIGNRVKVVGYKLETIPPRRDDDNYKRFNIANIEAVTRKLLDISITNVFSDLILGILPHIAGILQKPIIQNAVKAGPLGHANSICHRVKDVHEEVIRLGHLIGANMPSALPGGNAKPRAALATEKSGSRIRLQA